MQRLPTSLLCNTVNIMAALIEPKILKGFRDFLPPQEMVRRHLTERIEASFRSFGFAPIDTPALEYAEILLGKGGGETEKQIYRFRQRRAGCRPAF